MKNEQDLVQSLLANDEDVVVPADHERRIREGLGALLGAVPAAPAPAAPPAAAPPPTPPPALPPAAADAAGAAARTALRTWVTTGVIAALAAGGGFAAGRATAPSADAPPKASMSAAISTTAPPALPSSATSAEPLPTAPPASAAASTSAAPAASPLATSTTAVAGDAFDREQSLLERARTALVRHDASAAEKALDEHDRQFPRSRHAEERDYLRIQVLRERGEDARVRERAKAFLAKYPESMLRGRIEPLAQ